MKPNQALIWLTAGLLVVGVIQAVIMYQTLQLTQQASE